LDHLSTDRLIVVALFLGALFVLWGVVMRNRATLSARLRGEKRLSLCETLALGPDGRALLIEAEGRRILVLTARRGSPAMMDLGPVPLPPTPEEPAP
jgi:flagellar biogenesis protein FliO